MHAPLTGLALTTLSRLDLGSLSVGDKVLVTLFALAGLAMLASLVLGLVLMAWLAFRLAVLVTRLATSAQARHDALNSLRNAIVRLRAVAASRSGSRVY